MRLWHTGSDYTTRMTLFSMGFRSQPIRAL